MHKIEKNNPEGKNSSIKRVGYHCMLCMCSPISIKGTNPPDANDMALKEGRIKKWYIAPNLQNKGNLFEGMY
jgi:hypothetical protein